MKKIIFLCIGMLVFIEISSACDICGCSAGGSYLGILPQYQKHFIGFRYKYSSYKSLHPDDGSYGFDYFNTTELWGRFAITNRLHLYAILPYQFTKRIEEAVPNQFSDWGDASVLINYLVLDNSLKEDKQFKQTLQFGAGIKLPTGKHDMVQDFHTLPENLQPGTGTTDYLVNSIFTTRYRKFGFSADVNYKINQVNDRSYKQGNKFSSSARVFAWYQAGGISVLPHIGIDYEHSDVDQKYKKSVALTGGESVLASTGVDAYYKKFAFGVRAQNAFYQHLNDGNTTGKWRLNAQILYLF